MPMKFTLYQIDPDLDRSGALFMRYQAVRDSGLKIDRGIYRKVYGPVELPVPYSVEETLEQLYVELNTGPAPLPDGYAGRSMSVSDVVTVDGDFAQQRDVWYCDAIGFKRLSEEEWQ